MSERQGGWVSLGDHTYRFEEPDIFHQRTVGAVSAVELRQARRAIERRSEETSKGLFWLVDISRAGLMPPETREAATHFGHTDAIRGIVTYGGSYQVRVVVNMSVRAARFLRPETAATPVQFCSTEVEARAFIDELRGRGKP